MTVPTQVNALWQIRNLMSSPLNSYVRSDVAVSSIALVDWNPSALLFGSGPLEVTVSATVPIAVASILAPATDLNSYPLFLFADTSSLLFLVTLDPGSIGPNAIYGVDPTSTSLTGINCTAGSPVVTMTDTTGLQPGWYLNCAGVDPGTAIFSVDSGTQVTLVANATANEAGINGTAQAGVNLDPGWGYQLVYDWHNSYWRLLYQSVPAGGFSLVGINPSAGPFAGAELDVDTSTGLMPSNTSGGNPTLQMLDATDAQIGVVNTGTQTIAGDKTLIGSLAVQVPLSGLSTALLDGTGLTLGDLTLAAAYMDYTVNGLAGDNFLGGTPPTGYDFQMGAVSPTLLWNNSGSLSIPTAGMEVQGSAISGVWNNGGGAPFPNLCGLLIRAETVDLSSNDTSAFIGLQALPLNGAIYFGGGTLSGASFTQPNIFIGNSGGGFDQGVTTTLFGGAQTTSGLVVTPATAGTYGDVYYDPVSGDLIVTGVQQFGLPSLPTTGVPVALVWNAGVSSTFTWDTALTFLGLAAKGDLITWDNSSLSPVILPVGTDTYVLTADSTAPNGIAWEPGGGGGSPSGPAGGDLSGTYPNPGVAQIDGSPVLISSPATGDLLQWNGTDWINWTPNYLASGSSAGGDLSGTYPNPTVAQIATWPLSIPSTPTSGDVLTWNGTDWVNLAPSGGPPTGTAGGDLSGTYPNPTVVQIATWPLSIPSTPATGDLLQWNGTDWINWTPNYLASGSSAGGDLSGTYPNPTVAKIDGWPLSIPSTPTTGDILSWNGSDWVNGPVPTSLVIGNPVSGGTIEELLYVDPSGNLACAPGTTTNVFGVMQFSSGALAATFGYNFSAGFFQDASNSVYLCDGTAAIDLITGNIALPGTSGNSLLWNNGHAAPASTQAIAAPALAYGQGTILEYLGTPDDWVLVNVRGTDYLIPLYLP